MKRVPGAREVNQTLRAVRVAAGRSLRGVNQLAAQQMTKGNYEMAESLAAKGRAIRDFVAGVDELRRTWREACGLGPRQSRDETLPLWGYFQPILQALVDAGGEATRTDLEPRVKRLMSTSLLPGDRDEMARGQERWRVMVRRARKPLVSEGWIHEGTGRIWRITASGRRAAQGTMKERFEKRASSKPAEEG